jgi:predicted aldo/keto reductase-like oxidoreductase
LQAAAGGALAARAIEAAEKQAGGAPIGSVPKGKYKVPAGAKVPTRKLGRTGVDVSIVGLGGYHLGLPPEQEAIRMVRTAVEHGMNFLDNCWDYNGGESERRMGKALRNGWRSKAFVMTKLDGHTAKAATEQLDQSLKRLQTDVIDLVQIHEVIRPDDPEQCFAAGAVVEALVAARPGVFFTVAGYGVHPMVLIHVERADFDDLDEAITEAWLSRAPKRLARQLLEGA